MTTIKLTTESRGRRTKFFRARCNPRPPRETYSGNCRNTERAFPYRAIKQPARAPYSPELLFWVRSSPAPRLPYSYACRLSRVRDLSLTPTGNIDLRLNGRGEDFRGVLLDYLKATHTLAESQIK